jgi:hypothetical protein
MTCQCEFGSGNGRLAQIVGGTVTGVTQWLELPFGKSVGRSESEHIVAPLAYWEGRDGPPQVKAIMASCTSLRMGDATSSVLQWRHAGKVIEGNLGDHAASVGAHEGGFVVAPPISSTSEVAWDDALHGVGGARSIDDCGDSRTSQERRGPACGRGHPERMEESILPIGSRRCSFS